MGSAMLVAALCAILIIIMLLTVVLPHDKAGFKERKIGDRCTWLFNTCDEGSCSPIYGKCLP